MGVISAIYLNTKDWDQMPSFCSENKCVPLYGFYSLLFCSIVFNFIKFHTIPLYSMPFYALPFPFLPSLTFHCIPLHSIPFHSNVPLHSIPFLEWWRQGQSPSPMKWFGYLSQLILSLRPIYFNSRGDAREWEQDLCPSPVLKCSWLQWCSAAEKERWISTGWQ